MIDRRKKLSPDQAAKLTPEQASVWAASEGDFELMAQRLLARESTSVELAVIASVLSSPYWPWVVKRNARQHQRLGQIAKKMTEGARVHSLVLAGHPKSEAYKIADGEFRLEKEGEDLKRFRRAYKEYKQFYGISD